VYSSQSFSTDSPVLASLAMSAGGKMFPPEADPSSGRLVFSFDPSTLSPDFETKVLSGEVTLNAREVLASHNAVISMVQRHQRARRQGVTR
jgi:hypothetical protein